MPAFNTNRNVNLAVPLVRIGGQGRVPDTLPYLTNLKLFVWYTDLPIQVDLTGSLNYWQPYYSQSVISSSQTVYANIINTYPSGTAPVSRSGQDTPNYVDATPPYFSGSYLRQYSSSFQDYTQFSSLLNDISTSYTIAFIAQIDSTKLANLYGSEGTNEFTLWEKSVQNPKGGMPNYTKGVTYVSGSDNFKLYTGEVFQTGAIETYVMDTTASVNYINDDYHMIALSVTGNVATMYIDNQPLSGAFTLENFNQTSSIFTMGRNLPNTPNDVLSYLSNLKLFNHYTDLPIATNLSGSNDRWQPYYSQSVISASVSASFINTYTTGVADISRSAGLGPYLSGSYLGEYSSSAQQYLKINDLINDVSASYAIALQCKLNSSASANIYGAQGTDNITIFEKSIQSPKGNIPNYTLGLLYNANENKFKFYNGKVTQTGSIIVYDYSSSINFEDNNYHNIILSVSGGITNMYLDNTKLSGSFSASNWNSNSDETITYNRDIFTFGRNITTPPNDTLPNLSTLKKFEYYTDEPANTVLSGWDPINTNVFLSSSWDSYYSQSALNMNVSSSWFNTIKFGSDAATGNYPISRSAALEGPFMWGSISSTSSVYWNAPNQNLTSSLYQSLLSNNAFTSSISSSWTVINYIKPDPNNMAVGVTTNRQEAMALWNLNNVSSLGNGYMGAAFETPLNGRTFSGSIVLYTGISDGQAGTSRIKSGSYDIPTSINMFDGNYHMIATKFTQIGTGSYASGSVWIDGVHITGSWVNEAIYNQNEFQWPGGATKYEFGNIINNGFGSPGSNNTAYRAYLGTIKSWMTWGESLSNDDIQNVYSVLERNTLSPATNVSAQSITASANFAISEGIKSRAFPGEIKDISFYDKSFNDNDASVFNTIYLRDSLSPAINVDNSSVSASVLSPIVHDLKSKAFPGEIKGMAVWNKTFDQNDINNISDIFYIDDLAASENIVLP